MADKTFVLEFRQVTTGDGAQKLVEDINRVKALTDNVTGVAAQAPNALDPLVKSADELAEKIPVAEREMRRFVDATKDLDKNSGSSYSGLKSGIESLLSTMRNGGPTIGSFVGALRSASSVAGAGAAAGVGAVVSATAAVTVALVAATVKASKAIADFILEKEKLRDGVANLNFDKLENAKLTLAKQNAAIDEHLDRLRKWSDLAEKARASEESLARTKNEAVMSQATRESAERVAASGNDPVVQASEKGKLAALQATIDGANSTATAQREVDDAKSKLVSITEEQEKIGQRISENERRRETATLSLESILRQYTDDAKLQVALSSSVRAIDDEIKGLKDDELKSLKQGILERAKTQIDQRNTADKQIKSDEARAPVVDAQVVTANNSLQEATLRLQIAQDKSATSMIEAGKELGKGSDSIKAAIEETQRKLVEAKTNLAVTQGSTGAPASSAEQGAAYATVQQLDQQLAQLKAKESEMASATASFGAAIAVGANSIATESSRAKAVAEKAGTDAAEGAKASAKTITIAADGFKAAAAEGAGSMTEGIREMATSVGDVARGVAVEMKNLNVEVVGQFREMQRDIAYVKDIAVGASKKSDTALSQIANQR